MLTLGILTLGPGTAVSKYATVKVGIQRRQHFAAQGPILLLKLLLPRMFQIVPFLVYNAVQLSTRRISAPIWRKLLSAALPNATPHTQGIARQRKKFPR